MEKKKNEEKFPLREFDADLIRTIAISEIEKIFAYKTYEDMDKDFYISRLAQKVLDKIAPDGKGKIKYLTHITVCPKAFGPIDFFSNNYWDPDTDGLCVVDYENSSLHVTFTLWGIQSDK